jgi:hypothetical protein
VLARDIPLMPVMFDGTIRVLFALLPHPTVVPSSFNAMLPLGDAAICRTPLEAPAGTLHWPFPLYPHATTDPSDFSANRWVSPATICTTPDRPEGTGYDAVCDPHETTVPSDFNATIYSQLDVAANDVTPTRLAGGLSDPVLLWPHTTTVPSNLSAMLVLLNASTCTTPDNPLGMVV